MSLIHVIKQEAHNVTSVSKNSAPASAEVKWSTGSLNVGLLVHLGMASLFINENAMLTANRCLG
jgi:hypothetical protein